MGFLSYLLFITTVLFIATIRGEAGIGVWLFAYSFGLLNGLLAGLGGYLAGRVFEEKPYHYYR